MYLILALVMDILAEVFRKPYFPHGGSPSGDSDLAYIVDDTAD